MKKITALFFTVFFIFSASLALAGGTIVFTVDDGKKSTLVMAKILETYGYPATAGIVTNWIGGNNILTVDDLKYLYSKGWEIANHTENHPHFDNMTDDKVLISVENASNMIKAWGFPKPVTLINPYGEGFNENRMRNIFSGTSIQICRQAYPEDSDDTETMVNRLETFDPMRIKVFSLRKATIGTDWQNIPEIFYDLIYQAREENALVVFVVHEVTDNLDLEYNIPPKMLEDMTDYISRQDGVEVLTLEDAVAKMLAEKNKPAEEEVFPETDVNVEANASAETSDSGNTSTVTKVSTPETKTEAVSGSSETIFKTGETVSESETTTDDEEGEEDIDPPENVVVAGDSGDSGGGGGGCFVSLL